MIFLKNRYIFKSSCIINYYFNVVDNLILMVEYSDIFEVSLVGSILLMIKRKVLDIDDGGW